MNLDDDWKNGLCLEDDIKPVVANLITLQSIYTNCLEGENVINREATIRWKGHDPDTLTKGSHKKVWNNCIECGRGRWVQFNAVHDRCNQCAQFANKAFISTDTRMNMSKGQKKRFEDPNEIALNRLRATKQWESEEAREIQRKNSFEQWSHQDDRDEMSRIKKQYYIDHPEENELNRQRQLQYFIDNPEAVKRMSARMQGVPYEEWEGFIGDRNWRDWSKSIYINQPFSGCHRHHITKTIVVHIPTELHEHVQHNLKTGANMGEINILAFQYMNGGL